MVEGRCSVCRAARADVHHHGLTLTPQLLVAAALLLLLGLLIATHVVAVGASGARLLPGLRRATRPSRSTAEPADLGVDEVVDLAVEHRLAPGAVS